MKSLPIMLGFLSATLLANPSSAQVSSSAAKNSSLNVTPACPINNGYAGIPVNELAQFTVTYNPASKQATIKRPENLVLRIAFNGPEWRNNQRTIPLQKRRDGKWEGHVPIESSWSYAIFYLRDENTKARDDNGGQYWDLLFCGISGNPSQQGLTYRARSYAGAIYSDDIKRAPDFRRAIEIADQNGSKFGWALLYDEWYFKFRLSSNRNQASPELISEIEKGLADHASDGLYVRATAQFLIVFHKTFPTPLVDRTVDLADKLWPQAQMRRDLEREQAESIDDPRQQANALGEWLSKYPDDPFYGTEVQKTRLNLFRKIGDVESSEECFRSLKKTNGADADLYASMASIYILGRVKIKEALSLLDEAESHLKSRNANTGGDFIITLTRGDPGNQHIIDLWRGRAFIEEQDWATAETWLKKSAELDDAKPYALLARAQEQQQKWESAKNSYMEAAIRPSDEQKDYADEFVRLSLKTGTPSREAAMRELSAAQKRSFDAEHYVPSLLDLPAPEFTFTTPAGAEIHSSSLRGRTLVVNLWATWCSSCVPELAGFEKLQQRHPEITVLTVAEQSPPADVRNICKKQGISDRLIALSDEINAAKFGTSGVPQTYLIDDNGRIRTIHYGGMSDVVAYLEADLAAIHRAVK